MLCTLIFLLAVVAKSIWAECVTCQYGGQFCNDPPYPVLLPNCPEVIDELKAEMYTLRNPIIGELLDPDTVPFNFDPTRRTFFVTHGYISDFNEDWLAEMKDVFLGREDANVVILGWGGQNGSQTINYFEAASTTRTVGAYLGLIIENLISSGGGDAALMWTSGHSLGAHVCGYAGKWTQTNSGVTIDRITGMDPAGPDFTINNSPLVGLYKDDADFVDTINTDSIYGSVPQGTGELNFFPNGDVDTTSNQPGCLEAGCDHSRSHYLMTDSIRYADCFKATKYCGPGPNFTSVDDCSDCTTCPFMGYDAKAADGQGVYYLTTNGQSPYCVS